MQEHTIPVQFGFISFGQPDMFATNFLLSLIKITERVFHGSLQKSGPHRMSKLVDIKWGGNGAVVANFP
jgi:hypothetical protein